MHKILLILTFFITICFAKETPFNKELTTKDSQYTYEINAKYLTHIDTLTIKDKTTNKKYVYEINDRLLFCEGKEDGCSDTGVHLKKSPSYKNELIFLSGLVGAHSKKLFIFDPKINEKKAIREITAAFYIEIKEENGSLKIEYDKYCDEELPCKVVEFLK